MERAALSRGPVPFPLPSSLFLLPGPASPSTVISHAYHPIRPVDLRPNAATRRLFSERMLRRSVAAVRSYWQQRIFSGRGVPPPEPYTPMMSVAG